jgi:adenylate cyclase
MFAASARGVEARTIMSSNSASDLIGRAPGGRKLIAVLHADMVSYSRLIGLDDIGTLERLKTLRSTLIDPAIAEHGGRVANTGGDSLLIVFDSVDGAVQCAIKVQQQVPAYDGEQSPDRTIRFRVGINAGDVIPEGTDVHGDVVNVAARLQAECPPGGVCVSRAVRDHVRGRLDRDFEALGPLSLKNIAQPVEAFVLRLDSGKVGRNISIARMSIGTPQVSARPLLLRPRSTVFTTLALLVFAILGGIAWSLLRAPRPMQITAATPDFGIKNAPRLSLVVLPFQNLSGSPSDDYLADGITEDLTTDLSLIGAFVIARDSAYTYKGKGIDVKRIGEELGVRYVLEGSVRRLGELLRVNVQLISTESGAHLWADRSDEPMPELGLGQEEIVKRIGNALGWEMVRVEAVRSTKERPTDPDAFDLYLRAQSLDNLPYNLERSAEASALLERAVQLDPSFARAKAFLARTLIDQFADAPEGRTEDKLTRAATLLSDAEAIIPSSKRVLIGRASLLWWQERYPEALAAAQRLMEVYPNDADANTMLAILTLATGGADEAIPLFEKAIRLDPRGSFLAWRYRRIGYALLVLGREQESIPWLQRALAANPHAPAKQVAQVYRLLAAAFALTGHADDAHRAITDGDHLHHFTTVRSDVVTNANEVAVAQNRHYMKGLRLAGLRDHADENADFGVVSDGKLHRDLEGYTPTTVPGATTIRTTGLVPFLGQFKPIVIGGVLHYLDRSIPGAIGLRRSGLGGDFSDFAQNRLRTKMLELTKGDMSAPIVAVGWSSERFDGYNLTLRLVALGYTKVYWYRGGREAWEVDRLPATKLELQDW